MFHFEVQPKYGQRADYGLTVKAPSQYPAFVLVFNDDWNDYAYRTWFCLYYYGEDQKQHYVGELKIMCRGEGNTFEVLDKSFDGMLSDNFCSLAIEPAYYSKIHELFGGTAIANDLLTCLRDCAYNQNIYEDFFEDECFKTSLLREDSSQQAVKEAAFLLGGKDKAAAYSFGLHFAPDYLNGAYTDWTVKLLYDAPPFMRAVGLIGNNGVGKTQMMKMLVSNLISNVKVPQSLPLFRSCLAISSTPFDGYDEIAVEEPRIPYQHFTIEQDIEYTEEELLDCINVIYSRPLIHRKSMVQLYKDAIDELLGEEVSAFLKYDEHTDNYDLDKKILHEQIAILSSGQLHIFNLLTFIHPRTYSSYISIGN